MDVVKKAFELLSPCRVCPRRCGCDRLSGETCFCGVGRKPRIASAGAHFGEEPILVGAGGSGTIFFQGCNLGCAFCQNYDISHLGSGRTITVQELASAMLTLQQAGCHNINFVTPSHQVHAIVKAVSLAAQEGLRLPLVYNTGGYDSIETLSLLEGIFDIYMPDLKFTDSSTAAALADADDYPEVIGKAVGEMYRQVGDLLTDENGIAYRGLLVRHLVRLPYFPVVQVAAVERLNGLRSTVWLASNEQSGKNGQCKNKSDEF